jgi:glycosyltransferase involved in cell wall biosynthesis
MRLGIVVSEADPWIFFKDIYVNLKQNYETTIFRPRSVNLPFFYGRINRYLFFSDLRAYMRSNDLVFFEWASELLMCASHMPKYCPIVTRLHSFELYDWAPKVNWNKVNKIILVSHAMRQMFVDLYPEHKHKTEVVYNGVSLDEYKPSIQHDFNFNLGMLCRITPIKRIYETVLMFHSLIELGYDSCLHIAGEMADNYRYYVAVHRLVEKLNLGDRVIFYGRITETSTWLQKIDIFISNSYWEGQQTSLIEALASGCYCLSHFWDGAEEVVPQENLYISEQELMRKIIDYAVLPDDDKNRLREKSREIARNKFDIERQKADILRIVDETAIA